MAIQTITPRNRLESLQSLERTLGANTSFITNFLNDASRKESQVSQNLQTNQAQAIQTQQDNIANNFAEKTDHLNRLQFLAKLEQDNNQFNKTFGLNEDKFNLDRTKTTLTEGVTFNEDGSIKDIDESNLGLGAGSLIKSREATTSATTSQQEIAEREANQELDQYDKDGNLIKKGSKTTEFEAKVDTFNAQKESHQSKQAEDALYKQDKDTIAKYSSRILGVNSLEDLDAIRKEIEKESFNSKTGKDETIKSLDNREDALILREGKKDSTTTTTSPTTSEPLSPEKRLKIRDKIDETRTELQTTNDPDRVKLLQEILTGLEAELSEGTVNVPNALDDFLKGKGN